MSAKEIFDRLVERAWGWAMFGSGKRRPSKPGELIEKLSAEEREELKNLTSKDVKEVDRRLMYLAGENPSPVTVHKLFPSKKDDEDES